MGLREILASFPRAIVEKARSDEFGPDYRQRWQKYQDEHVRGELQNAISTNELKSKTLTEAARMRAAGIGKAPGLPPEEAMGQDLAAERDLKLKHGGLINTGLEQSQGFASENQGFAREDQGFQRSAAARAADPLTGESARAKAAMDVARQGAQSSRMSAEAAKYAAEHRSYGGKPQEIVINGKAVMATWDPESGSFTPVSGVTPKRGSTVENRLDSAMAVNQTGNDIIRQLKDPKVMATVGPLLGRASSLRDLIGNPPPEFAGLAGQIESYSLANMGVHGMRSAQGAKLIGALLDRRHTAESLISTIEGLNGFSRHYMENEGVGPDNGGPGAPEDIQTPANTGVIPAAQSNVRRYNPATRRIE
jgi:hypothetical protein